MSDLTDDAIVDVMDRLGGSFVKALAACWRAADAINRATLKDAFPEHWAHYAELAQLERNRWRAAPPDDAP